MGDLERLSIEELEQELGEINSQRDELAVVARQVSAVLNRKVGEREVRRKLEKMSEGERAALAQIIRAEGIESGEAVGQIGQ